MKRRMKRNLFLGMALLMLLSGCGKKEAPDTQAQDEKAPDTETQAETPDTQEAGDAGQIMFEAQDTEGNMISSSVLSNSRLTMINVWATYCNPCLREMPGLGELAGEYDAADFQMIGIISDVQEGAPEKTMKYAMELIEQTGADYPHLLLNESLYYALLTEVSAVPTTFFLDQNGRVLDTVVGSMEKAAWEEKIDGLLEKE